MHVSTIEMCAIELYQNGGLNECRSNAFLLQWKEGQET